MKRAALILILSLLSVAGLIATDFNWGLKYGIGVSDFTGRERAYELCYKIDVNANPSVNLGHLKLKSNENKIDLSHSAGLYAMWKIFEAEHALGLSTELYWQRYQMKQAFNGVSFETDDSYLATAFAYTVNAYQANTVDYITLPVLITLFQNLEPEKLSGHYQGAFSYIGPSVSYKLSQKSSLHQDLKDIEAQIDNMSYYDAVSGSFYGLKKERIDTGIDAASDTKIDLVLGAGMKLKDLFQMGFLKDEFVFDLRFTTSLGKTSSAKQRSKVGLKSVMFGIGYRL